MVQSTSHRIGFDSDEPEKAGFKAFQRIKKGPLAKIPMILTTATVAPESFAKHRSLKVHADEYLDKRTLSKLELLGKLDNLIGLGEPADDDLVRPAADVLLGTERRWAAGQRWDDAGERGESGADQCRGAEAASRIRWMH